MTLVKKDMFYLHGWNLFQFNLMWWWWGGGVITDIQFDSVTICCLKPLETLYTELRLLRRI